MSKMPELSEQEKQQRHADYIAKRKARRIERQKQEAKKTGLTTEQVLAASRAWRKARVNERKAQREARQKADEEHKRQKAAKKALEATKKANMTPAERRRYKANKAERKVARQQQAKEKKAMDDNAFAGMVANFLSKC